MTSTYTEDDIDEAVNLAIAGRMNPEAFKKVMPQSYAMILARTRNWTTDNYDPSIGRNLLDQVFAVAQSKLLQHPTLMTEDIPFRDPDQQEQGQREFKDILTIMTFHIGTDRCVKFAHYRERFVLTLFTHVEQRCNMGYFISNSNQQADEDNNYQNRMIFQIYYVAYRATAYQFQEEMETYHFDKTLNQLCTHMDDKDGFVRDLKAGLEEHVTLPSQVTTVDELLDEAANYFQASAIKISMRNVIQVIVEFPNVHRCLQCWVCQKDNTKNCSSCNVAAFCGKSCLKAAWKRNHKVLCPHFGRIREYAQSQWQRVVEVHKQGIIPGSGLVPNLGFDNFAIILSASLLSKQIIWAPILPLSQRPSIDHFYQNYVTVANDHQAFRHLFKPTEVDDSEHGRDSRDYWFEIGKVCAALMYNGNAPEPLQQPKITRASFLREYRKVQAHPMSPSEDLVLASVTDHLLNLYQREDYSALPADTIRTMVKHVADSVPAASDN